MMRLVGGRAALLSAAGFAAVMVAAFLLSFHVRIPWVLEQYPTGDTFLRGLQSNYELLAERYSREVGYQFVTLRIFAIPCVIGALLLAVPFFGQMTGYVLQKLSMVRISVLVLILPIPIGGAVLQAFYSPDALGGVGSRMLRSGGLLRDWPLIRMVEYWFFWVAMTPMFVVAEVVLAAAALVLYFQRQTD